MNPQELKERLWNLVEVPFGEDTLYFLFQLDEERTDRFIAMLYGSLLHWTDDFGKAQVAMCEGNFWVSFNSSSITTTHFNALFLKDSKYMTEYAEKCLSVAIVSALETWRKDNHPEIGLSLLNTLFEQKCFDLKNEVDNLTELLKQKQSRLKETTEELEKVLAKRTK